MIYLFFIPAEIIFQNTTQFTLPQLLIWFYRLTHTYMSFEEDPECPWDGSLAAISWYLLLTFRLNQSPTLTTGSSTSHLLILWEFFGWHIKQIRTQKPHNQVKKYSIYLNWVYNASQTEKKKNSWSKPIVPVYTNGFWGPNSEYVLGVSWEAWDKTARSPVVKDHSFNIMTTRINVHRKFDTGKSYQTCTAWKTINSKHLREYITAQSTTGPQWW